jgi:uncharacterized OB-fold protein
LEKDMNEPLREDTRCDCGRVLATPEHFKPDCEECMLELRELKPEWFMLDGTLDLK